ncbi:MAG: hypothetical protein V4485_02850 [Pseudomonadota bacterium]
MTRKDKFLRVSPSVENSSAKYPKLTTSFTQEELELCLPDARNAITAHASEWEALGFKASADIKSALLKSDAHKIEVLSKCSKGLLELNFTLGELLELDACKVLTLCTTAAPLRNAGILHKSIMALDTHRMATLAMRIGDLLKYKVYSIDEVLQQKNGDYVIPNERIVLLHLYIKTQELFNPSFSRNPNNQRDDTALQYNFFLYYEIAEKIRQETPENRQMELLKFYNSFIKLGIDYGDMHFADIGALRLIRAHGSALADLGYTKENIFKGDAHLFSVISTYIDNFRSAGYTKKELDDIQDLQKLVLLGEHVIDFFLFELTKKTISDLTSEELLKFARHIDDIKSCIIEVYAPDLKGYNFALIDILSSPTHLSMLNPLAKLLQILSPSEFLDWPLEVLELLSKCPIERLSDIPKDKLYTEAKKVIAKRELGASHKDVAICEVDGDVNEVEVAGEVAQGVGEADV